MTARILFTGPRVFADSNLAFNTVRWVRDEYGPDLVVVHGAAPGADTLVGQAARRLGLKVEPHSACWRTEGRAAGPLRNQRMVNAGASLCVAFLVPPSVSPCRGTRDCAARAKTAGIPVRWYAQEAA